MLPVTVAQEVRTALLDYLRTTFGFRDKGLVRSTASTISLISSIAIIAPAC